MTLFSRNASLLAARTILIVGVFSLTAFGAWTAGGLRVDAAAQKKPRIEEEELPKTKKPAKKVRVEEEEDTSPTKPKRKVIVPPEEEESPQAKSTTGRSSGPAVSGDLKEMAEQASHPAIKKLFQSLAMPYDLVLHKPTPGVTVNGAPRRLEEKIEPTPFYLGDEPTRYHGEHLRFMPLTDKGHKVFSFVPNLKSLEWVRPYEKIAQAKVRQFLGGPTVEENSEAPGPLPWYEKLIAAEQALKAVLRWHESARQKGKRRGEEWDAVENDLRKQLLDKVMLEQMKVHVQAKDQKKVLELARRLAATYTDPSERQRIFQPVAKMIQNTLDDITASEATKQQARKRLHDLDREFPGNSVFAPIRETLRSQAQALLKGAKELARDKDDPQKLQQAREFLKQAQARCPELAELRAFEYELRRDYPILRVGVRGPLPQYFSPAWACTDNERRAVEMLFESLVKRVPDRAGGFRYRPGLAASRPKVVPLGRQFELPHHAVWSDGRALNPADIYVSLQLLQKGKGVGRSQVWGKLLDDARSGKDPFRVTLRMTQGFLDPLALMSFKILPGNQHDPDVNSEAFARNPVSSGPFLLDRSRQSDENGECLFFKANPYYSSRPTKLDTPHIQEVRFYRSTNAVKELEGGKVDLVLDLTAEEAQELLEKRNAGRLAIEVPLPSPAVPNRRIYFLAINTRKLPDAKLRRALAFAIDREALLNKHFRASLKAPIHRTLNGPFPSASWACNPELTKRDPDLHDAVAAKNLSVGVEKPAGLTLKYPQDHPALAEAMKDLCDQIKDLTGLELEPTPRDPHLLREEVQQWRYDVAYCHYDFPDEGYWLGPLLRSDGAKNMFRFSNPEITKLLAGTESYREFAVVCEYQHTIHKLLYDEMPFIPLWQLDPLLAYRRDVEPVELDPQLVFGAIEEWRLRGR